MATTEQHDHAADGHPLDDLFIMLEREARARARDLENQGRLPHGFTATHYPLTPREQREARRLNAALMLAPTPEVFCALARGEHVPRHRLRPDYLLLLDRWPR